jgi:hypothetical protein
VRLSQYPFGLSPACPELDEVAKPFDPFDSFDSFDKLRTNGLRADGM